MTILEKFLQMGLVALIFHPMTCPRGKWCVSTSTVFGHSKKNDSRGGGGGGILLLPYDYFTCGHVSCNAHSLIWAFDVCHSQKVGINSSHLFEKRRYSRCWAAPLVSLVAGNMDSQSKSLPELLKALVKILCGRWNGTLSPNPRVVCCMHSDHQGFSPKGTATAPPTILGQEEISPRTDTLALLQICGEWKVTHCITPFTGVWSRFSGWWWACSWGTHSKHFRCFWQGAYTYS